MENASRFDIERFKEFGEKMRPLLEEHNRVRRKLYNSYDNAKKGRKKYQLSEKGKKAREDIVARRKDRLVKASIDLSEEETYLVDEFYKNTPKGFHVDHIIPLSKGGLHRLSNLQYLEPKINAEKASRLNYGTKVDDSITFLMGRPEIPAPCKKKRKRRKKTKFPPVSQYFISLFETLHLSG